VFTGRLGIPREKAAALARKAGASVQATFNARTDLLIVGTSSLWAAGDAGGQKLLAAAAKRESGDASTTSPSNGSCASSASAERLVYLMLFTQLIIRHSFSSPSWAPPCGIRPPPPPGTFACWPCSL
jgi:hypothetical protein